MNQTLMALTLTASLLTLSSGPGQADTFLSQIQLPPPPVPAPQTAPLILPGAKNLARQAAEQANGGLENYRAEPAMYGPAVDGPYVDNGNSWTFTFKGGRPGADLYTVETVVTVTKDGSQVRVDYNGPIRQLSVLPPQRPVNPPAPAVVVPPPASTAGPIVVEGVEVTSLTRGMNLARQAAEQANGGVEQYRAEAAMFGPAAQSPHTDGGDRWIFTFKGGAPGAPPTIESVVAVAKDGSQVEMIYNGPPRAGQ